MVSTVGPETDERWREWSGAGSGLPVESWAAVRIRWGVSGEYFKTLSNCSCILHVWAKVWTLSTKEESRQRVREKERGGNLILWEQKMSKRECHVRGGTANGVFDYTTQKQVQSNKLITITVSGSVFLLSITTSQPQFPCTLHHISNQ